VVTDKINYLTIQSDNTLVPHRFKEQMVGYLDSLKDSEFKDVRVFCVRGGSMLELQVRRATVVL
jgi:hypothetical protein